MYIECTALKLFTLIGIKYSNRKCISSNKELQIKTKSHIENDGMLMTNRQVNRHSLNTEWIS